TRPTLLELPGCGALTAAKIVGEVAGAARFRSRAAFARWDGTAPIPVWSGTDNRFRLNRGGNRQVNAALHRVAVTQWRGVGAGRAYAPPRLSPAARPPAAAPEPAGLRCLRGPSPAGASRRLRADELHAAPLLDREAA